VIITRTPFRVSLFGGGTDHPEWFSEHGGEVVGMAINKYCYISVRHLPPFFDHRFRIVWSRVENTNSIEEIQHPSVRGILQHLEVKEGLEIHHDADLPARTGLGSSSSFTVGFLSAVHALRRHFVGAQELAEQAIHVEREVLHEAVGCQDQVWAAFGGMNRIVFNQSGTFSVRPVIMAAERQKLLTDSLFLVFTGLTRFSSDFAASQIQNIKSRRAELRDLQHLAAHASRLLQDSNVPLQEIGKLMHDGWQLKRALADNVSSQAIDQIYDAAREAGALGGKILGAGGGGFMLLFANPEKRPRIRERLRGLVEVPVDVDYDGSKVVVFQPTSPGT
jgi:D-glycero-alpha-D-manno-heptose-7-phosphate kinase